MRIQYYHSKLRQLSYLMLHIYIYLENEFKEYKNTVWTNLALFDEGQLRQRVAYALYQIIPIGTPDTAVASTEIWLQYYDIFVRVSANDLRNS